MSKRKQEKVICSNIHCGKEFLKDSSEVKRNEKKGRKNYCSLTCSGKSNNMEHLKEWNNSEDNKQHLNNIRYNRRDEYTGLREHYRRVKKRSDDYDITLEDLLNQWKKQKGLCVYSGVKLIHPINGGDNLTKASLDRIDSTKGYVKGNIQFISIACNHAKNSMSHEEMIVFCGIITKHHS